MDVSFLFEPFIQAMNEIGKLGEEKYGDREDYVGPPWDATMRTTDRTQPDEIARHAAAHFQEYLAGIPHDYFGTRGHQLAAVAFNAMLEFYFHQQAKAVINPKVASIGNA